MAKDVSFNEFASQLLAKMPQPLPLSPECFGISKPAELKRIFGTSTPGEAELSKHRAQKTKYLYSRSCGSLRSMQVHLKRYRKLYPNKLIFDLSQTPEDRGRTDLKDGSMPTLARSSTNLWPLVSKIF